MSTCSSMGPLAISLCGSVCAVRDNFLDDGRQLSEIMEGKKTKCVWTVVWVCKNLLNAKTFFPYQQESSNVVKVIIHTKIDYII